MGGKNFYVVFRGRKVGIYKEWIDCHSQVVKFKCSAYKGYQTREEAEIAWQYFCNTGKVPVELQEIEETATWSPGVGTSSLSEISLEGLTLKGADDSNCSQNTEAKPNDFLIEYSNQALLVDVCHSLMIPPPSLTLLDTRNKNGVPHHRYGVCVTYDGPHAPPFFIVGDFNTSHEEAKDSASWLMLQYLVGKTGKRVKDFNYHIVDQLVSQLSIKEEEMRTMAAEIAVLDHEIETLKSVFGYSQ